MKWSREMVEEKIASFRECGGPEPSFKNAHLEGLDLCGLDLSGLEFLDAHLMDSVLTGAKMDRIDLFGADLYEAKLDGASMVGADLCKARAEGADFSWSDLTRARLFKGSFDEALFRGADLTNAQMIEGEFQKTDFTGSRWSGANISWALMHEVVLDSVVFATVRGQVDVKDTALIGGVKYSLWDVLSAQSSLVTKEPNREEMRAELAAWIEDRYGNQS